MSSSFLQLVLDFLLFAIIHYYIIFPLMTKLLDFINGQHSTENTATTAYENVRNFISEKKQDEKKPIPPFTIDVTNNEDTECERCGPLLENQVYVTRTACQCTWCAECVEACFAAVKFDLDAPLKGLSRHCEGARQVTMRQMVPYIRGVLSEKTRRYVDTIGGIEMGKNDWMLDDIEEDEEETR